MQAAIRRARFRVLIAFAAVAVPLLAAGSANGGDGRSQSGHDDAEAGFALGADHAVEYDDRRDDDPGLLRQADREHAEREQLLRRQLPPERGPGRQRDPGCERVMRERDLVVVVHRPAAAHVRFDWMARWPEPQLRGRERRERPVQPAGLGGAQRLLDPQRDPWAHDRPGSRGRSPSTRGRTPSTTRWTRSWVQSVPLPRIRLCFSAWRQDGTRSRPAVSVHAGSRSRATSSVVTFATRSSRSRASRSCRRRCARCALPHDSSGPGQDINPTRMTATAPGTGGFTNNPDLIAVTWRTPRTSISRSTRRSRSQRKPAARFPRRRLGRQRSLCINIGGETIVNGNTVEFP